jgi:hypothetical protein
MPLNTRTLSGQAVYGDNTGASGRLLFTPDVPVAYEGALMLPGPVTVIAGNGGTFEVDLATTDTAGYSPEGWVWKVEELWPGGRVFFFQFPEGDGSPVDYTSLIPAESIADPFATHEHPQYLTNDDLGTFGVSSVNGDIGDVFVTVENIGALPDDAQLSDLTDVEASAADAGDLLSYDGDDWVPTDQPTVKRLSFDTVTPGTLDAAGDLAWDDLDQALSYRTNGLTVDIAQENLIYVRSGAGRPFIPKGAVVAFDGVSGNRIQVQLCDATAGAGIGCRTAGVALTDISANGFGFVSTFGLVRGYNTGTILSTTEAPLTEGAELFISSTPGVLATFPATSPARRVTVGYVVTVGTQGAIFVTVRRGLTVNELDNVLAASPLDRQPLAWDNTQGVWAPVTLDASDVSALPDDAELDDLADVSVGGAMTGDVLAYDGDDWVPDSTRVASTDVASIVVLAETEYDALDPADPTVLYVVIEDPA